MGVDMLVRNCSPTLAGLKAGNIFSCAYENETAMRESVRLWNTKLVKKGLRVIPLRWQDGRALIYVYRVSRLDCDLRKEDAQCLLRERGYACDSPERCIVKLIERLRESSEFPHEIGLFLGYPPEDVKGFIAAADARAEKTFDRFDNAILADKHQTNTKKKNSRQAG